MPKSLKYQVVKLAKENPQLRKHLLPLVTGKRANSESLRLSLTKLAYENPSLRSAILPLVKSAMEHSSPEARKQYLKDHPNADPKNHTVKKQDSGSKSNENGGFKSKADLDKAIDDLNKEIEGMNVGFVTEISDSSDDYDGAGKKIQKDFQRYYSKGDITKGKPNIATLIEGFSQNSVFKVKKFEEMKQGLKEAIELFQKASKETDQASADPYIEKLNKMFNSMAKDLDKTLGENPDLDKLDDKVMEMQKLEKLKKNWKEPKKEEKSESEKEKSESEKEKTKAEKLKDYEDAIKNSDMSAEEKEKAIKRSKKPNFDVDGALSGMGDEEESGGRKASLRYRLVRLAHQNPKLRKHILPLVSDKSKDK